MTTQVAGRLERKYLVGTAEIAVLRQRLSRVLRPDKHAKNGIYHVRSLYFDDLTESALFDKLAGVRDRHKWRLRIYDRRDVRIRLECKIKRDKLVYKEAVTVSRELADRMIEGVIPVAGEPLVQRFALAQRALGLKPVVIVDYLREPFTHRAGDVRVTLDQRLRSGLHRTDLFNPKMATFPVLDGDRRAILEVKSTGLLPWHVSALLPTSIAPAAALSKYALCRRPLSIHRWEDP